VDEGVYFSGNTNAGILTSGKRRVILTGVGDSPVTFSDGPLAGQTLSVSDFVYVNVYDDPNAPSFPRGYIGGRFESDGATNFLEDLMNYYALAGAAGTGNGVFYIAETGDYQEMGGDNLLNINELMSLQVRSDISEVPIPPAVLLLGSGLLSLAEWRRFRKG
jgi:hypothetical protein